MKNLSLYSVLALGGAAALGALFPGPALFVALHGVWIAAGVRILEALAPEDSV